MESNNCLTEYQLTQTEQMELVEINQHQIAKIRDSNPGDPEDFQQLINEAWNRFGEKYGFKPLTVQESAQGMPFFLAEPDVYMEPLLANKTALEEFSSGTLFVPPAVKAVLKKIAFKLEFGAYKSAEGSIIEKDSAFRAIKQMSE